jgi:ATP-dependent helicase/nuclease subunit A
VKGPKLSDLEARERVAGALDRNILVEAGAGSGKTTLIVRRLLTLVRHGVRVDQIAAVTFTRQATNELRERFQQELEAALAMARDSGEPGELVARLDTALRDVEQAFIGTIHSFCGRLLREHPLEAQVDPGFSELDETEAELAASTFWERWLGRARADELPELRALEEVGVDPRRLRDAFAKVVEYPDVDFGTKSVARPSIVKVRKKLRLLLDEAEATMPAAEPEGGWDALQKSVRFMRLLERIHDWDDPRQFCDSIARLSRTGCKIVQKKWGADKDAKEAAKALEATAQALIEDDIEPLLDQWYAHRHGPVLAFVRRAAEAYREQRFATGHVTFEDLLLGASRLLRVAPDARRALGERWRYLLVDEFQDTDPIQAEVCLLLASDPSEGNDWRRVTPRDGALVVVGDPKQSIYRFRRADIQTYELVKRRFAEFGEVQRLTQNFRSVQPIADLVNRHFAGPFPPAATFEQAAFAELVTAEKPEHAYEVVRVYDVVPPRKKKEAIHRTDAEQVAAWIADRVQRKERVPGDFLVLTARRDALQHYATAIARHGLPVTTSGAALPQEWELRELVVLLQALADPSNPILVAAALEGLFVGLTPADLWDARQAGVELRIGAVAPARGTQVEAALARLQAWCEVARREPADLLLARILDETGLLPYAASQPLGDNRGGALLHLVEAVRGDARDAAPDLRAAIETIERVLEGEAPDALLVPGRTDAVQVMNLHRAKGLEAPVVILASPTGESTRPPLFSITRREDGTATAGFLVRDDNGDVLAQPPGWHEMAEREARFEAAERVRLLYVAATRAKRELVVSRLVFQQKTKLAEDTSAWSPLAPVLRQVATPLVMPARELPDRARTPATLAAIESRLGELRQRQEAAQVAGWVRHAVTRDSERPFDAPEPGEERRHVGRGREWGTAVHRVLEARGRGRTGDSLARFAAAVAKEVGVEGEVAELLAIVARLEALGTWEGDAPMLVEAPITQLVQQDGVVAVREGIIDAARLVDGRWVVTDWKTDLAGDEPGPRQEVYQRQVDAYAAMMRGVLGVEAKGMLGALGKEA